MYRQLGLNSNLPLDMGTPVGGQQATPQTVQAGLGAAPGQVPMAAAAPQAPLAATMTMADRKNLIEGMVAQGMNYSDVLTELRTLGLYDGQSAAPEVDEVFQRPGFGTVLQQSAQNIGQDSATGIGTLMGATGDTEGGAAVREAGQALFGLSEEEKAAQQQAAEEDRYGRDVADAIVGSVPSFALIGAGSWVGGKAGAVAGGSVAGPVGAAVGGTIGAAIGGVMSALPMMIGSATKAAEENGHDMADPRVQQEVLMTGASRAVLESIGPNIALGVLRQPAKEMIRRGVARGAINMATKTGLAEGSAEVMGELLEIAVFDPEVRSKLSQEEVAELAPFVAEKYGRELSIAFIAGKAVGGAGGAGAGGIAQARTNTQRSMDVETLAEAAREGGLDVEVLNRAAQDPQMVPALAKGAREVGQARSDVERARQLIEAASVTGDADMMTEAQSRLQAAVTRAETAYDSIIPKLGGLDRQQVKAKAQLEVDRAKETLRNIPEIPSKTVDGLEGSAARKYASQIETARDQVNAAKTALVGPESFDAGKREALQKELRRAEKAYQDTIDDISVRSGAKTTEGIKAERETRSYNEAVDRQFDRKFKPLVDAGDAAAVTAEANKIIKAEAKGKNKGLNARLRKLERDLDGASTTSQIDAIEKDIAEVKKRMGREAPIVAAAKRAIAAVSPQQGTGQTQGTSPVSPTPTPAPDATQGQGTQTPATAVSPAPPTETAPIPPVEPAPATTPAATPPVQPPSGTDGGTVTPPSGSPDGGNTVNPPYEPPAGSTTQIAPDGTATTVEPDGTKVDVRPDGSQRIAPPDGSTIDYAPDGTTTVIAPDRKTTLVKRPDGSESITRDDGSRTETASDGTKTDFAPDGTRIDPTPPSPPSGTPIKPTRPQRSETTTPRPAPKTAAKRKPRAKALKYDPDKVHTDPGQNWTDMLADFNRTKTTTAIARKWILEKAKKKDVEYIVAYNTKTGEVLGAGTNNREASVGFTQAAYMAIQRGDPVTVVHNHPSGGSLSGQDTMMLYMYPGELTVVAVTDRGIQYTGKRTQKGRKLFDPQAGNPRGSATAMSKAFHNISAEVMSTMVKNGEIDSSQTFDSDIRNQIFNGVTRSVNRTFGRMGYMTYSETGSNVATTLEVMANDHANKIARKAIRESFAVHSNGLAEGPTGIGLPEVQRSSEVRPDGSPTAGPLGGLADSTGDQRGRDAGNFAETGEGGSGLGSRASGLFDKPYAFQRLDGLPDRSPGPNQRLARAATRYMLKNDMTARRPAAYTQVDPELATRLAQAYEAMPHDPTNPKVREAYEALARETEAQYEALIAETGMQVELMPETMPDPYPEGPKQTLDDMANNNHLWVLPTDQAYGDGRVPDAEVEINPMLAMSRFKDANGTPMRINDLFRAVHDAFGHGREGVGFGPAGEENTWQSHVRMFSPLAARAMTTETRGQNSWVNFGPRGEQNRSDPANTIYAPQKIGLLPDWAMTEGVADQESPSGMDLTVAEVAEKRAQQQAEIDRLNRIEGPVRLMKKDGSQWAVVSESTYAAPWRVTRLDSKGPFGHSDFNTREDAIREAVREGFVGTDTNSEVDAQTGFSDAQSLAEVRDAMPTFKAALAKADTELSVPGWLDIRTSNGKAYQDMLDRAKTPVSTTGAIFKWLERQVVNSFAPIRDLELSLRGELGIGMDSAFKAAEIAVNDAGRNEALMHYGAAKMGANGEYTVADGTVGIKVMLAKLGKGQAVIDWMEYMGARRAQEIKAKGFKAPLTDEDIAAGLAKETAVFKEVAAEWKRFNDANVDFVVASGRISKALGEALKADAAYVPFYRTDTAVNSTPDLAAEAEMMAAARAQPKIGSQVLSRNPGIYKMKGDETLKVNNLIENMIRNSQAMVAAGMRNQAANKVFSLLKEAGMVEVQSARTKNKKGKYIQKAKPENSVRMWKDGKESYIVPMTREAQPMMIALGGLQPVRLTGIADAMAKIGSFFRQSITLSPSFIIRNMIRDTVSTGVLFSGRNLTLSNNALTGFKSSMRNSASRAMYTTATGMGDFRFGGGDIGLGRNDLMIEMGIPPHKLSVLNKAGYTFRQFVGKMEELGTASELSNRIAVFESLKESGVRADEAAYQALTIVNYGRRGAYHPLRVLMPMVPFLNARIQGLARIYEPAVTMRGPARRQALAQLALNGAILSMFSSAIWAWNHMDEERKEKFEAEPLHRRLNYHVIYAGDKKLLIPKAFEIGTMFSTAPELMMEALIDGDTSELGDATIMTLLNTFAFNPIPAAMLPAIEVLMDYNMFTGRPIEGPRLQSLMREDRINPQTAALAIGLARSGLGDFAGLSPVNMDHLLTGYGGVAYQMLATMVDTVGGDLGLLPSRPEGVFGNMPVVTPALEGTFRSMFKDAEADPSNRYVEDFYEIRSSITQLYRSAKMAAETGDIARARELLASAPNTPAAYKLVNKAGKNIGDINSAMRKIRMANDMPPDEKRRRLDVLTKQRNRIATEVMKVIREAEKKQNTSFKRAAA